MTAGARNGFRIIGRRDPKRGMVLDLIKPLADRSEILGDFPKGPAVIGRLLQLDRIDELLHRVMEYRA